MLKIKHICKRYGDFALSDINLSIPEGEYFVLLGRSGSGKTQLLELIAGLNYPDSGEIWIDNVDVTRDKMRRRNTGLMFQDFAIFPNMTVFGNIAYPLHCRKYGRKEITQQVNQIAGELNISHLLTRFTQNLSAGELQRVALARTLITSPKLLLLDEPMASIDASLRDDIKKIFRHLNRNGLTIVHVTHDYREAVSLAARVGVLHNGRIVQEGTPNEVFNRPASKFVARYAGIKNFFSVRFISEGDVWKARSANATEFILKEDEYPPEGLIIIRNDSIKIHIEEPSGNHANCFKGIVTDVYPTEYGMEISVEAGLKYFVDVSGDNYKLLHITEASAVWITFPAEAVQLTMNG
jgi:molybdate/tungstate transport system ATP-binding protein